MARLEPKDAALALLLALVTFGLFARAAANGFVAFDDPAYLGDNPHVAAGWTADGVRWAFGEVHAANWHPLTWLSHMLDVELFGLEPGPHHLVSVGWHALAAGLCYLFVAGTTGARGAALVVAASFAWHPLRVESVVWAAERKDVLATAFWMLSLLAYRAYARSPSAGRMALVALALALGLLAKSMLVTLPCVLLLLDRWPLRRWEERGARRLVLEKLPLFALAAASALVTLRAQAGAGAANVDVLELPVRLANAGAALAIYVEQTFWPVRLACFYPHAGHVAADPLRALLPAAAAGLAGTLAVLAAAWRLRRACPALGVGALWFLGTLVPVLGLFQVGSQAHADRYTYVPSVGLFLALTFGVRALARRLGSRALGPLLALPALGACAFLTWRQVPVWRDSATLFAHALEVTEDNYLAHNNYGRALLEAGDDEGAVAQFDAARAIYAGFAQPALNLGLVYHARGDLERALGYMEQAWARKPDQVDTNRALGGLYLELGRLARAEQCLRTVLDAGQADASVWFNLGYLSQRRGRMEEAAARYRRSLELAPDGADAWNNLGEVLLARGSPAEAVEAFRQLVRLEPGDPAAHHNLGVALERLGRTGEARAAYRAALAADAGFAPARARLEALRSP